jgi:glutamate synthase domain-containing protein 1
MKIFGRRPRPALRVRQPPGETDSPNGEDHVDHQTRSRYLPPLRQGLYDPANEHDACGVGFVVDLKGRKSHDIVRQALTILNNLEHRGACGCEVNTGDGAGILIQTPDRFFRSAVSFTLPESGSYGAGLVFLPRDERDRETICNLIAAVVDEEGAKLLGWRDVPSDNSLVGDSARATQPVFQQVFIGAAHAVKTAEDRQRFERKLTAT